MAHIAIPDQLRHGLHGFHNRNAEVTAVHVPRVLAAADSMTCCALDAGKRLMRSESSKRRSALRYSAALPALSAGRAFKPAAQPTIPAMKSSFKGLAGSTPVTMAQPTVNAAPIPTQTA